MKGRCGPQHSPLSWTMHLVVSQQNSSFHCCFRTFRWQSCGSPLFPREGATTRSVVSRSFAWAIVRMGDPLLPSTFWIKKPLKFHHHIVGKSILLMTMKPLMEKCQFLAIELPGIQAHQAGFVTKTRPTGHRIGHQPELCAWPGLFNIPLTSSLEAPVGADAQVFPQSKLWVALEDSGAWTYRPKQTLNLTPCQAYAPTSPLLAHVSLLQPHI